VFKKVRSIDNAELVVKSLLGTSTAFEKQMAALEQEQADLDKAATPLTEAQSNPKAKPDVIKAKHVNPVANPVANPVGATTPEKKKPGRKPKIQLIVKDQSQ
jgi:hypothetical protein